METPRSIVFWGRRLYTGGVEHVLQKDSLDLSAILKSELFSNLLPGEKQSVTKRTGVIILRKGGFLFSPGKKADHLYLLLEGVIRVFKSRENGGEEEIARFAPGDIIGDFDFARDAEYDAHAEALEDASLVMFPGFGLTLDSYALDAPHIVSKILLNSAAMVTSRIKSTRRLIIESMSWVQELHRQIHEDPGTGLWKQSFLHDEINRLLEEPMALIMLKPDRFKNLVDTWGHDIGDKAMIKIASILKGATRKLGRGWALRFRSNETGVLVNRCDVFLAESLARSISASVAALNPIPISASPEYAHGQPGSPTCEAFTFSCTIAWALWPADGKSWNSLFEDTYTLLMDTWRDGGNRIVRYSNSPEKGQAL